MEESYFCAMNADGKPCVVIESSMPANAGVILTPQMLQAAHDRLARRAGDPFHPQTYDQWFAGEVMRAAKRRLGL